MAGSSASWDYSKFDNLDVSDDEPPLRPDQRYSGPSAGGSAYAKQVVERQRAARAKPQQARACAGDNMHDVSDVYRGDAHAFTPLLRDGRCLRWGLPAQDPATNLKRRAVTRELYADTVGDWRPAPERQFVQALMRRKVRALRAAPPLEGRLELRIEVATFRSEGLIKPLRPPVYRVLRCDAAYSLAQSHAACFAPALGWTGEAPYAFVDLSDGATWTPEGGKAPGHYDRGLDTVDRDAHLAVVTDGLDPRKTRLGDVLRKKGDVLGYCYGRGEDAWEHTVTVVQVVDEATPGVVIMSGAGGCPDERGGPNSNYQTQVLDRLLACGSERYASRRISLQGRCHVFIAKEWKGGRVVSHRGPHDEAYHVMLDEGKKVAVKRDAPELIEPEGESDEDENVCARLFEDACRARDRAPNYEGRFEPEAFDLRAARRRVVLSRSNIGPRGERVCVVCGAAKSFACGACGLSAYCGLLCQGQDFRAHCKVCTKVRKEEVEK